MTTDKPMTMVERVARAIIIAECGGRVDSFSRSLLDGWKEWEDVARAAIEAMREPTDGMAHEFYNIRRAAGDNSTNAVFDVSRWESEIDAALKE